MKKLTVTDIIVIVLLFALSSLPALHFLLSSQGGEYVIITSPDGESSYALNEDRSIELQSGEWLLSVEIKDSKVKVSKSNCPDRVCVHTGSISKDGSAIVCLPAQVTIEIYSGEEGYDAISG